MKVSMYDVTSELTRRGVKVNSLENLTTEALIEMLPEVEVVTEMGNSTKLPNTTTLSSFTNPKSTNDHQ